MRIRPVRPEEHDHLASLTVAAYAALGGELDDGYRAELADVAARAGEAEVLVAVVDADRVVGGITYITRPGGYAPFLGPGEAGLRMLAVAPEAQGRGMGTALVRACVERATAEGLARVCLQTTDSMVAARRIYRRLGFSRAPERDTRLGSGLLLLAFVVDLAAVASGGRPGGENGETRGA